MATRTAFGTFADLLRTGERRRLGRVRPNRPGELTCLVEADDLEPPRLRLLQLLRARLPVRTAATPAARGRVPSSVLADVPGRDSSKLTPQP